MAKLLIVDDEAHVRFTLREVLVDAGHDVVEADGGAAALACCDDDTDAVITDLSMPGMDGSRLIREAKRRWPGLRTMLMTGLAADADSGLLKLADLLLRKPIEIGTLQRSLAQVLPPRIGAG